MVDECVLHVAGSKSPRGSGWAVVVRSAAGLVVARASGGEAGASSYRMELLALLRGLESVPGGTRQVEVRLANNALARVGGSLARGGGVPRKAQYPELLKRLPPLLEPLAARWVELGQTTRDAWDKEAKLLAQTSAFPAHTVAQAPATSAVEPRVKAPAPGAVAPASAARVVAFTDGGCRGNPGPGGWGFLIVDTRTHAALERRGGERHTTNNRMEITAALRALEALKGQGERVEVRSDSKYLVDMCSRWIRAWKARGWRRKDKGEVLNLDLVKRLDELMARHDVRWTWVKGHAGDHGNEHVDRLANEAMDALAGGGVVEAERRYGPGESPVRVAGAAAPAGAGG